MGNEEEKSPAFSGTGRREARWSQARPQWATLCSLAVAVSLVGGHVDVQKGQLVKEEDSTGQRGLL